MTDRRIYILDRVTTEPGCARNFVDAYMSHYAPRAARIGMTLDRVLVSPPVWFEEDGNTVTAIWTVTGHEQWWRTTIARRFDDDFVDFWDSVELMVAERSRSMAAAAESVEEMCRV
ncbi:hypothetical protein [Rhodococcus phenolicus]|uniref:hypothetical protein n=1 Tax=Rhodococcus phenolicus TaxID=263849 RepID=UPI00082D943D|nr:hypothetical protein [Rhodococcus phenolicus]